MTLQLTGDDLHGWSPFGEAAKRSGVSASLARLAKAASTDSDVRRCRRRCDDGRVCRNRRDGSSIGGHRCVCEGGEK